MTLLPPPSTPPAGWYPDPSGTGQRYFDGYAWAAPSAGSQRREEHPTLPFAAAIGAIGVLVVSLLVGKMLVDWLVTYEWPVIVYVGVLALVGYGPSVAWAVYVRRRWGADRLASLGWRFRWSDLAWGPLTWLSAVAAQIALGVVVLIFDIPLSSNVDSAADLDADRAYLVATLATAVIAAPVVEEVVFRGLVLRGFLSRMGPPLAIVLQGVLFGVAHVDPVRGWGNVGLAMVLSGIGVVFGISAYLARRVGPTVVAHAILNAVVLAIVLSGVLDDIDTDLGALAAMSAWFQ